MRNVPLTTAAALGPTVKLVEAERGSGAVEKVLKGASLNWRVIENPRLKIRQQSSIRAMTLASRILGNPLFGLELGQAMQPVDWGLIGRYVADAPDLGSMMRRTIRSIKYHQTHGIFAASMNENEVSWSYRLSDGSVEEAHIDHVLATLPNLVRICAGDDWKPKRVDVQYQEVAWRRQIENFFDAPVRFGQERNAIVFDAELLHLRRPQPENNLPNFTLKDLRQMVAHRPSAKPEYAVLAEIRLALPEGDTTIDRIAFKLGTSKRSLQRNLNQDGASFRDLVARARMLEATDMIRHTKTSLTDIAHILGYSDQPNFNRAFQKWTEMTPGQYRRAFASKGHLSLYD